MIKMEHTYVCVCVCLYICAYTYTHIECSLGMKLAPHSLANMPFATLYSHISYNTSVPLSILSDLGSCFHLPRF